MGLLTAMLRVLGLLKGTGLGLMLNRVLALEMNMQKDRRIAEERSVVIQYCRPKRFTRARWGNAYR